MVKIPYIKPEFRPAIDNAVEQVLSNCLTDGDFNYAITKLMHRKVEREGKSYHLLNRIMGIFECAKNEFYARVVRPYEDEKILENGDV